ncbi:MAG: S-layer domain protein [Petrotoga mobilis]|nr:MAG: S-layer domain protein [Petrotoga mobilis]
MKKTLAFFVVTVFVVSAFSLGFTDVGEDHWAYDYVMKLVEKGVIPVDEPTFRGYEPLTRSDAAVWMSRLVTYLENSPEIAKTRDLSYLEAKVGDLSKKVNNVESQFNSLNDQLQADDLLSDLQATYQDVKKTAYRAKNMGDALETDLLAVSQDVAGLKATVSQLEVTVKETKSLAEQNQMFVKALPTLSLKVASLEEQIASLEEFKTSMAKQHLNLKYDTYDKIDGLTNRVSTNEKQIASLSQDLADVKRTAEINQMFVKALPDLSKKAASNEAKITELSQVVEAHNAEIAKAQDKTMLWLVAGLGVILGVVGIFMPQ